MTKYQFFCIPDSNRQQFTYVDMADTPQQAVEHFKSNFI